MEPREGAEDFGKSGDDEGAGVRSDACAVFVRALAGWAAREELRARARRTAFNRCPRDGPTPTRTITLDEEEYRFEP